MAGVLRLNQWVPAMFPGLRGATNCAKLAAELLATWGLIVGVVIGVVVTEGFLTDYPTRGL